MGRSKPFKQLIGLVTGLIIVTAGLLIYVSTRSNDEQATSDSRVSAATVSFKDEQQGISFEYVSSRLTQKPLSEQDKKDNIIASFNGGGDTPMLITVQYENSLSKVSNLLKREPLDMVLENSDKVLPKKYPDFKKVSQRQFEYKGKKAAEVVFTYTGNNNEKIKQKLFIVIRDRDTAFYILAQSRESDFAKLESEVFDASFESLNVDF